MSGKMNSDAIIACNIVRKLFRQINLCVKNDRSKVKLSGFAKGVISSMLSDRTLNGINGYIVNMNDYDLKVMIDEIEIELKKEYK